MAIIHEFENLSVVRTIGGDYFIEIEEGDILILSPNGSDEHKGFGKWIEDPDREEADFIGEDLFSFLIEKNGGADESWNCPECGDQLLAMEFGGQWWELDSTSARGWYPIRHNIKPDYSGIECGCIDE